jgi:hypothetical protein
MKYLLKPTVAFVLLLTICWHAATGFAQGTAFSYQGNLNVSGASANGSYDLTFTLFSSSNAIGQLGDTVTNLNTGVTNGLFAVALDFGPGIFTGPNVWLQLGVRTNGGTIFTTLAPLQPITPSPYAIFANTASNLLGTLSAAQLSGTLTNNTTGNAATATTATYASSATTAATATNAIDAQTVTGSQSNAIAVSYFTTNSAYKNSYMSGSPDYTTWPDGYNTWFENGAGITEHTVTNAIQLMKANGLAACGLTTISLDGGDFTNRDANGIPQMDLSRFPDGFPWLCHYALTNGFKMGVFGIAVTNAGLSGEANDYYFYGAEAAGANYFLTNGVTYFKFDAPIPPVYGGTNGWPNLYDFHGNLVTPFAANDVFDQSYLTFATLCRRNPQPVFFNASHYYLGTEYGANVTTLLNSWRFTSIPTTNSLGQISSGDIVGSWQELLLWTWINQAAQGLPPQGGWEFPDFDTLSSPTPSGFDRHMYASAEFGSIFQTYSPVAFSPGYQTHSWTNELSNPLLKQIRSRGTIPHFAYATNGCYIYTKDNLQGGLDVLVENENYNDYSGGFGTNGDESTPDFGELVLTNYYIYNSANYYYQFYATNAVLDFGRLGLSSTNCLVTTLCRNLSATVQASGALPVFVMAAGANLYTINPVNSFPAPTASTVALLGLPFFNFWTTNNVNYYVIEPGAPDFTFITNAANAIHFTGASYWGINGASSFSCLDGCDNAGNALGSQQFFYVDGVLAATSPVWTAGGQFTNVIIHFTPANQILEIVSSNTATMQYANFNFTNDDNYSGSFAGNGAGLTGLNASALASGTVPLAQIPVQVVTNNSSNITLDAPTFLGGWTNTGGTIYNSGVFTNGGDLGIGGNEIVAGNLTIESGGVFSGNASGATSLNASALSSGTIPTAVLPGSVPTSAIITTANGLTNSYSLSANILSITIGQTNSWPVTNAMAGGGIVNAALPVTTCFTNASFTFAKPVNVQMNGYSQPVIEVRNSGGTPITITPEPGWHPLPNSVWVCTNESMISLFIYPGLETNANCTPVR